MLDATRLVDSPTQDLRRACLKRPSPSLARLLLIATALTGASALAQPAGLPMLSTDFLYLGRGINFPIALEGALKLKEISYIHAEGYAAGEMKHGPNALIDSRLPVVVINTLDPNDEKSRLRYEKTISNIQEVKARDGIVVAVVTEGDKRHARIGQLRYRSPALERAAVAGALRHTAAIARLPHRGAQRLRR